MQKAAIRRVLETRFLSWRPGSNLRFRSCGHSYTRKNKRIYIWSESWSTRIIRSRPMQRKRQNKIGKRYIPSISKIRGDAKRRGIPFEVDRDFLWNLFLKQNKKCILTNLPIKFAQSTYEDRHGKTSASLDRIDSTKGYLPDNVAWVHKDINIIKNNLDIFDFYRLCHLVAEKARTRLVAKPSFDENNLFLKAVRTSSRFSHPIMIDGRSLRVHGKIRDLTGERFGHLYVEQIDDSYKSKTGNRKYIVKCECGEEYSVFGSSLTRKNRCLSQCRRCSYRDQSIKDKRIPSSLLYSIRHGSKTRRIPLSLDVSPEYLWSLFIRQKGLCALTDLPIHFANTNREKTSGNNQTASLDRIDSNKSYTCDNLQWVYKTINRMKNKYDQNYFIKLCTLVDDHVRNHRSV